LAGTSRAVAASSPSHGYPAVSEAIIVGVSASRDEPEFHGQDPIGLGAGVAVVGHGAAVIAAYLAADWVLQPAGGPDVNLDAGDRFGANAAWLAVFGVAEVIVFTVCLAMGVSALARHRTRFGGGILGGWVVGLVVAAVCGVGQLVMR
jgi:hypothetical protein